VEVPHVQLAGRGTDRAVRPAVDVQVARTTDAFAAIVVKRYGLFPFFEQCPVQFIEHFQERHMRVYVHVVVHQFSLVIRVSLTPYSQFESHIWNVQI
jgi:hypothetical protein